MAAASAKKKSPTRGNSKFLYLHKAARGIEGTADLDARLSSCPLCLIPGVLRPDVNLPRASAI